MNPFAKHIPSVFVVCSPFQVLCAIAAIKQLEIECYKMIVLLPKGEIRNSQTIFLLDRYCICYEKIIPRNPFVVKYYIWKSQLRRSSYYKRLFIGDLRHILQYHIGFCYVADNGDVVYLDDGSITISYLNNNIPKPMSKKSQQLLNRISQKRGLVFGRSFLTIYGDIDNSKYNIKSLFLHHVIDNNSVSLKQSKDVYIVGTNTDSFCKSLEIPEDIYIRKLGELMQNLRYQYPDDIVYFVPHGREYKDYGERLCEQYGCEYLHPQMMIEMELLNMPNPPKAIYGYTSTALFSLKKLFPSAMVMNILFDLPQDTPIYKGFVICSEYYRRNGIKLIKEPLL